jgi:UDP-N-acetylglucosamine--N-acetylmuramyl-(pentapeptide) pyrophosphoryl-undecaprenol N-acetylglucosamine transferase
LVLQEQNAYPGITNKWLAPLAKRVLLGNEAAGKFFDASKVKVTGNPVRQSLTQGSRERAIQTWSLDASKPVVLSLGGSLGAGTLNNALEKHLSSFGENGIQLLWQSGKRYHEALEARLPKDPHVRLLPFIEKMEDAYAVADLVITRAGASTLSELILLSKPSILVPSPNVAEDHQTKNALSLVEKGAAILVKDAEAGEKLVAEAIRILNDKPAYEKLKQHITAFEKHDAANLIAREIMEVAKK